MNCIALIACSGPGALNQIVGAEADAKVLLLISIGITAFVGLLALLRPPAGRTCAIMALLLAIHPGMWADANHGDCGTFLRRSALVWTIVMAVVGAALLVCSRLGRPHISNDYQPSQLG